MLISPTKWGKGKSGRTKNQLQKVIRPIQGGWYLFINKPFQQNQHLKLKNNSINFLNDTEIIMYLLSQPKNYNLDAKPKQ